MLQNIDRLQNLEFVLFTKIRSRTLPAIWSRIRVVYKKSDLVLSLQFGVPLFKPCAAADRRIDFVMS